jgi:hypothetical protein
MAMVEPDRAAGLLKDFHPEKDRAFLAAAVEVGQAVDDSRIDRPARPVMSVDRLPWEQHAAVLEQLRSVVDAYLSNPPSVAKKPQNGGPEN